MPDFVSDNTNGASFEASVRQVATQLYRKASFTGSIVLHGRERDEIIDTGTELIIVEATQLRRVDKIKTDLQKSIDLVRELRREAKYEDYNFRILLVTANDPTADQQGHVQRSRAGCPKEIISFTTLFSRLFDAKHYIRIRKDHIFGSVRDPANEANFQLPERDYIPTALNAAATGASIKSAELAVKLKEGGRYIIYGDYGSGKSMTLRDIYFHIRTNFSEGQTLQAPIYLNLREHIAQTQPDEALYRHAEKIGFEQPHSLIAAWRAGFVTLFLDGFDELTPPQFASSVSNLRQARRFAVELVQRFIEQTPLHAPIIIAGRESYFDSRQEAKAALGYDNDTEEYDLAGFTDKDIGKYLKAKNKNLPRWLPTRPLLLGYLANAGLLKSDDGLLSLDPAKGWDELLQRVCEREVKQIWGVGFEASDLRLFLEGLATLARKRRDNRGLDDSGLKAVFRSVFGRDTDEPANLLTGRLPGLGSVPGRPGAREFIDNEFADVAAAGDLRRYIEAPFAGQQSLSNIVDSIGELGRDVAAAGILDISGKVSLAIAQSAKDTNLSITTSDAISILIDNRADYRGAKVYINGGNFNHIIIDDDLDLSNINFSDCAISSIELGRDFITVASNKCPSFTDCVIGRFDGAISINDVPKQMLLGSTSVEVFSAFTATNDAVMSSPLPDPVKVLMTVLRKLYMQRGTGRQYSALRRGLPPQLRAYVDPIVALIETEGYAETVQLDRRAVLIPLRSRTADALSIINGPNVSLDPLIKEVRKIEF